jgi:hypothetical protein
MPEQPENTGRDQAGRFQPGRSGHASGKPKGARHKTTIMCEKLLADDAADVVRATIAAARNGDMTACRLVLDRILPLRRARVAVTLPEVHAAGDLPAALAAIVKLIGDGTLAPDEGAAIGAVLEQQRRAIELTQLDERLRKIEERMP